MPQEKRRSINYRSFIICDDPRGVVECRSLRKSNIISPQKREHKTNKSLNALIEEEKKLEIEDGIKGELLLEPPTPSFQLNTEKGRFGYLQDEKPNYSLMKNVVRDSLVRQCVITNPVFEHHFEHRKHLGSPSDMPSSSSSRSSMIYSSYFGPSDYSSISSTSSSQRKKGKNSNVVYKLMGIESFPSSPVRNRESEKNLKFSKPMYDIASPRALGLKERSVHEILETLKIKGLLKSKSVNEIVAENKHGKPPIVVMKPSILPKFQRHQVIKLDSSKAKASVNVNQKTQRKQETVKKAVKVNSSRIKGEEKKIVKSRDDIGSQDEPKFTPSVIKKQKDRTLISKNRKTTSTAILDCKTSKRSKNRQSVLMGENQTGKGESEEIGAVYEEKKANEATQNNSVLLTVHRLTVENFPPEKQAVACCVSEYDTEHQNSRSNIQEDMPKGSHKVENEADFSQPILPQLTLLTPNTKLKALILSNPSFVSQAEELLHIQLNRNSIPPLVNDEEPELADTKLLLDCANEVMELRTLRLSQPFPRSYNANSQNALSLDRLLDEICNGIDDLKGYLRPTTDVLVSDALNSLIDRDLRFKSGTWEIGWRNAFSQDEVEQVIGHTDKLILGILIEEILVDFL